LPPAIAATIFLLAGASRRGAANNMQRLLGTVTRSRVQRAALQMFAEFRALFYGDDGGVWVAAATAPHNASWSSITKLWAGRMAFFPPFPTRRKRSMLYGRSMH